MARDLKEISATGAVTAVVPAYLHSVVLTGSTGGATVIVSDGSGGATRLTLKVPDGQTVVWTCGDRKGVLFGTSIYATLTGTSAVADFEFS